ncbi:acyl-CoA dehydrogenase family protein [Catellatospora sp. NPDC049111]|uniref:acyl-CoA dehydrogenase family protein n=1 Tax=Catellatospora sp. NPDC049111 TaxID=3155271 RepID=UPI0033E3A66D
MAPPSHSATTAEAPPSEHVLALATELAATFAAAAHDVDESGRFPADNVRLLRESGLLGTLVPTEYGGLGQGLPQLVTIAGTLGAGCASTAMIWAMHCQQVATLVRHGSKELRAEALPRIAAGDCLLASITTEAGKGGHLLSALSPLQAADGHRLGVERDAPVVTGGMEADAYLITMRTAADRPANDVSLAYVPTTDADVAFRSGWQTLGMRGTASVGVRLTAQIDPSQLINGPGGFRPVAVETMIPVGHLAWAAVWLGTARGAFRFVVDLLRNPKTRGAWRESDLAAERLARVRLQLDTLSAYLWTCLAEYQDLLDDEQAGPGRFGATAFQLHVNNLKVLASETSFQAVDDLITIAGLRHGYVRSPAHPLERAFRDLRAAALMYSNDRLMTANGRLALLDRTVELAGARPGQADRSAAWR